MKNKKELSKKELSEKELSSVNGGYEGGEFSLHCDECSSFISLYTEDQRTAGSGCSTYTEYKCPNCGHWQS